LAAAGKRLLEAVEKGDIKLNTPAEAAMLVDVLEAEGPTPAALAQLGRRPERPRGPGGVRPAAVALARPHSSKASVLAKGLWAQMENQRKPADDAVEALATLARVEEKPDRERWKKLLTDVRPEVRTEAVRWWRMFEKDAEMMKALIAAAPK